MGTDRKSAQANIKFNDNLAVVIFYFVLELNEKESIEIKSKKFLSKSLYFCQMLEILYQDEYIIAINKPSGLLVHKSFCDAKVLLFKN
jgi:23S rRNA-/tRNA-specific pseudouridylate synthase